MGRVVEETELNSISRKFIRPGFRVAITCHHYLPRASAS